MFAVIEDEETFNIIIQVLTRINFNYTEEDQNLFCVVYQENENARFLIEGLLRSLNSSNNKETMYQILKCFYDIMNNTFECVLYSSDLEAFINLSLKKLESSCTDTLIYYLFQVLLQITIFDDYFKINYKITELVELLESYENCVDVNDENRSLASKILENIKMREK